MKSIVTYSMMIWIQILSKMNYCKYEKNTKILFENITMHNKITKLTLTLKLKKKRGFLVLWG